MDNNSTYDVYLAGQFRKRDNTDPLGAILGDVISTSPLKIAVYNNQAILTEKQCYICSKLLTSNGNIALDSVADHGSISTSCTISNIFNIGDRLLCLPIADGQTFFIIDKVVNA